MQIGGLLNDGDFLLHPFRQNNPAYAQTRCQNFRKRRGINYVFLAATLSGHLQKRFLASVSEANRAVRIIFNNDEVMFFSQFDQLLTAAGAQCCAAWVAKSRNDIDAFNTRRFQQLFQFVDNHPVLIATHGFHIGFVQAQNLQRRQISWALNHKHITRVHQRTHQQIQRLLRARGDQQLF
ncbi:hypothetical protein D3C75_664910 [compost metagenome]